jgi:dynein heavy chain
MEKYLFRKQLRVGVFLVDVEQYASKCQAKIKEATSSLYDMLIKKIAKENAKLEDEIKEIMGKLVEDPKDIERLHALRTYANDELGTDLGMINGKINKVMEKMTLMEKLHYKISYENFSKSWSIYGMPLKLLRKKEKCIKRLQGLERRF